MRGDEELAENQQLDFVVSHFVGIIKEREEYKSRPNKEIWAISQIYRFWEVHKEQRKQLKKSPVYNNDDIMNEISKHFKIELL